MECHFVSLVMFFTMYEVSISSRSLHPSTLQPNASARHRPLLRTLLRLGGHRGLACPDCRLDTQEASQDLQAEESFRAISRDGREQQNRSNSYEALAAFLYSLNSAPAGQPLQIFRSSKVKCSGLENFGKVGYEQLLLNGFTRTILRAGPENSTQPPYGSTLQLLVNGQKRNIKLPLYQPGASKDPLVACTCVMNKGEVDKLDLVIDVEGFEGGRMNYTTIELVDWSDVPSEEEVRQAEFDENQRLFEEMAKDPNWEQTVKDEYLKFETKTGEADGFSWRETETEVYIFLPIPWGVTKDEIQSDFERKQVRLTAGELTLEGDFPFPVVPSECYWTFDTTGPGKLLIELVLQKADESSWGYPFEGEPRLIGAFEIESSDTPDDDEMIIEPEVL